MVLFFVPDTSWNQFSWFLSCPGTHQLDPPCTVLRCPFCAKSPEKVKKTLQQCSHLWCRRCRSDLPLTLPHTELWRLLRFAGWTDRAQLLCSHDHEDSQALQTDLLSTWKTCCIKSYLTAQSKVSTSFAKSLIVISMQYHVWTSKFHIGFRFMSCFCLNIFDNAFFDQVLHAVHILLEANLLITRLRGVEAKELCDLGAIGGVLMHTKLQAFAKGFVELLVVILSGFSGFISVTATIT